MTVTDQTLALRRKLSQRVTIVSVIVNLLLSIVKIVAGYLGHSQALVADGIHSLSDLISDAFVLFAARHASTEADTEHPYGHLRFETIATFVLAIFLAITGIGIMWDSLERLISDQPAIVPATYTLAIAVISIAANEALFWYTIKVANTVESEMLKANAWHHRTDAISSIVVLIGLVAAVMGYPYLDTVAAIIVALMILHVAWEFGWKSAEELVDKAVDEKTLDEIRQQILAVQGVESLHHLRTRMSAGKVMVDMHILVASDISVSEGHSISETVIQRLKDGALSITDVTVHVDPEDDEIYPLNQELPLRDDALKEVYESWTDKLCIEKQQRILLHYLEGKIGVELYLPLDCYETEENTAKLKTQLFNALDPERYRQVDIYYG